GVAGGAQEVDLLAGRRAGDPLAGAVGRGGASVEGEGGLGGDQGAAVPQPVLPAAVQGGRRGGESLGHVELDVDPGGAQAVDAAGGDRVRVGAGDDHAADAGLEESFGAGAGA